MRVFHAGPIAFFFSFSSAFTIPSNVLDGIGSISTQVNVLENNIAGIADDIGKQLSSQLSGSVSVTQLKGQVLEIWNELAHVKPDFRVNDSLLNDLSILLSTPWHAAAVAAFAFGNALLFFIASPDDFSDAPFEPGTNTYNPVAMSDFYAKRPLMVFKRILRLTFLTGAFNTGLLFDWLVLGKLLGDEEYMALRNAEPRRAKDALVLCQQLGPTFIKLGQALSIRTDLIPASYALELRQLQDAVPPFDSDEAVEILRKELQVSDIRSVFSSLSPKPVASASIGQVYRGTLVSNGKEVAVKVQRPGILAEIALDLHVLRILTPIQTILQNAANRRPTNQADIDTAISLVDEWGRGFVAETDYRLEAENTRNFEAAMRKRNLDAVCAPIIVDDLVRDKVLVTEWVTGTRLDRDESPDVPRLCGVAINAYLTMLLDTGVLHCDPHPGTCTLDPHIYTV
jgi:ABC1 atypical kinase-like domain